MNSSESDCGDALRELPYMGVIYVVAEAMKLGFTNGHPDWSNLGQGQPEVGEVEGAPPRIQSVDILPEDHAYGPVGGTDELREAVAAHYNRLYRRGKKSQYGPQNVCITLGGRGGLTRAAAALGGVNIGYQLPDYTAYEDLFELHLARLTPIPVRAYESDGFRLPPRRIEQAIVESGLSAFLVSNPCNPTGNVIEGEELDETVALARRHRMCLLLDEFYSHFVYTADGKPGAGPISGAEYVEDVDRDPVLLFDGLTKSYRYPGWRSGWIVGPQSMIETLSRTASFLDGGASRIVQRATIQALEPDRADQETRALREAFARKRATMVEVLKALGIRFAAEPVSTFYCWASLDQLPEPFSDSDHFFRQALSQKVMTVPGRFFDVNPGSRRAGPSPYQKWMRFSFGPPYDNMVMGLERLRNMLAT